MKKAIRSLIALGGLTVIAVATSLLAPSIGLTSSLAGQNAAAANQPQNVNVVNVPTVNSQQSGNWDVSVTNQPTVQLAAGTTVGLRAPVAIDPQQNTVKIDDATPVSVQTVSMPFQVFFGETTALNGSINVPAPLPPGKTILVEHVYVIPGASPFFNQPGGTNIFVRLILKTTADPCCSSSLAIFPVPIDGNGRGQISPGVVIKTIPYADAAVGDSIGMAVDYSNPASPAFGGSSFLITGRFL